MACAWGCGSPRYSENTVTTISAKTILRSRHSQRPDKVLSTLLLRYPRCIHAEFMTHRVFSRNAASSRAIPVKKLIQDVMDDPFVPLHWGANQKGMQSIEQCNADVVLKGEVFSEAFFASLGKTAPRETILLNNRAAWIEAMRRTVEIAQAFSEAGYHKQIVNRLLEPFAHITVVVSSTEWSNFLALRDHKDAEPHIQILAREVRKELDREDNIQTLKPGEWHLPFVTDADIPHPLTLLQSTMLTKAEQTLELMIKKSVACCASTSYKTVDGFEMTLEKAIELHDKLVGSAPLHASPAEHVAQADEWKSINDRGTKTWFEPALHKNFVGFKQYRAMLPNECL